MRGESRARGMTTKLRPDGRAATLAACAAFERAGEPDDVDRLCRELARVEGWSPIAVRYWLAKLWGDALIELGRTRPTPAGWAELEGREAA